MQDLTGILQKSTELRSFSLIRAQTVFPFVKGTEYEMSLEAQDELLLLDHKQEEKKPEPLYERCASIDEFVTDQVPKRELKLSLEPDVEEFVQQLVQFLKFNKKYGDGWSTALKVKVYGSWSSASAKIILKDLGLVPRNYVEPS